MGAKYGTTTLEPDVALIVRMMTARARPVVALADSSSAGLVCPALVCPSLLD